MYILSHLTSIDNDPNPLHPPLDLVSSHLQPPPLYTTRYTTSPPHYPTIRTLAHIDPVPHHPLPPPTPDYPYLPIDLQLKVYIQYTENTSHDDHVTIHQPTIFNAFTPTYPLPSSTLHTPTIKTLGTSSPNPSFSDTSYFSGSIGIFVECNEYEGLGIRCYSCKIPYPQFEGHLP